MKLSIVIPTFNRKKLLSEAIDSIIKHVPDIYEIVIADDASTDDTYSLYRQLHETHTRTRIVWKSCSTNRGAQVSRNRGFKAATGDLVMFMDSDDVLASKGLTPLLLKLQKCPSLDYVYGKVTRTNQYLCPVEGINVVGSPFSPAPVDIAGYHWHTMGAIYRKEYLYQVGSWNEALTGSQDWEFQARVKLVGGTGEFINHTVGLWRDHSNKRVGTKKFRLDYVESVIKACLLIHEKAHLLGKLDRVLEHRLMKKLLFHTLELSANDYSKLSKTYIKQAIGNIRFKDEFTLAIRIFALLPHQVDSVLFKTIARLYNPT